MSKVTILTKPNRIVIASKGVQGAPGKDGVITPELEGLRDEAQQAAQDAAGSATIASDAAGAAVAAQGAAEGSAGQASASAALAEQARLLGATIGFATKADMDASLAHPDGTLALVTNDATAANNGTYRKTGASGSGSWVQSADRVTGLEGRVSSVESVAERVEDNDGTILYDSSYWIGTSSFDQNGVEQAPDPATVRATGLLPVKAGEPVVVTTRVPSRTGRPAILVYDADEQFVRGVLVSEANVVQEVSTTMEADGFVRAQWSWANNALMADGVAKVEINKGKPLYLSPRNISDDPTFNTKADKARVDTLSLVFEQGGVNPSGVEYASANEIRTAPIKVRSGATVRLVTSIEFMFASGSAATATVPLGSGTWRAPRDYTFTVPEGHSYVRFMFRRMPAGTPTAPSDGANLATSVAYDVAYKDDLPDLSDYASKESVDNLRASTETRFIPTYRTPSQAEGGVVSFIDDDGAAPAYSALYPFMKTRNIPFGVGVNPTRVGTGGYATLAQLKEMAADTRLVEIMNHGFEHLNMSGLTTAQQHAEVIRAKRWLAENGFETEGFILPYGGDTPETQRIVSQYYNACYDYGAGQNGGLQSFTTIRNMRIVRFAFDTDLATLLANVTTAAATGQWLVICTHVENYDWTVDSWANLQTLIDHIQTEGCKIMLPSEAFHVFGNLLEADNGFKINALGQTIPASP